MKRDHREGDRYNTARFFRPHQDDCRVSFHDEMNRKRKESTADPEQRKALQRGKGPKNYQRSDARIQEDVHDVLQEDPHVDASDIEVTVENGHVVLSGEVDDRNAKRRAEDILEVLSGIKNIENKLRVQRLEGNRERNHED